MKTYRALVFAAAVAAALMANAQQTGGGFRKPPAAALKALKGAVGKPFNNGWVFIDGKLLDPPYKVERYGTVLRVNGIQVTGEIVPWEEFIKTQKGVKVSRTETPAAGGAEPAAEPVEEEPEPELEPDDDWENSLDDLFDDEPSSKKKTTTKKKSSGYKPRAPKPTVTVSYSFDGEFVPNEKSNQLLQRINTMRTKFDSLLRGGGYCCFSSRYPAITADGGAARHVFSKLPALMKQHSDQASFTQAVREAGCVYFSSKLIEDFFRNRVDYIKLQRRYMELQEKAKLGL